MSGHSNSKHMQNKPEVKCTTHGKAAPPMLMTHPCHEERRRIVLETTEAIEIANTGTQRSVLTY